MTPIYHITTRRDWSVQRDASEYTAPSLASEGFIHASDLDQIVDTANLIFRGTDDLLILVIDTDRLTAPVKSEDLYGHGAHPHIYGPVNCEAVVEVVDFPCTSDGSFTLPDELTAGEQGGRAQRG